MPPYRTIPSPEEPILLMMLDKFLNLKGTSIQGYLHLENIGIVFRIESNRKIKKQPVLVVG